MRCPSCGAVHSSDQCPESTTAAAILSTSAPELQSDHVPDDILSDEKSSSVTLESVKTTSRLIEFPGVVRSTVPQWRKELSHRVREVQEKRAREAAFEKEEAERLRKEQANASPPQLELLPQTETPEINPLVAAALKRIERAHQVPPPRATSYSSGPSSAAGQVASGGSVVAVAPALKKEVLPANEPDPFSDRPRNLVVVQSSAIAEPESSPGKSTLKPKRLIADDDPALHYLDSVATTVGADTACADRAPMFSRLTAAVIDLLVVTFLSLPFAAIIELQNRNWLDPRIAGIMGATAAVAMFIYLTVSTALTGRTLGMGLVSLRAIDTKTGLIPTGKQSAGRALLYILSLATLGIGCCYALVNGQGQTVHDRLSRTAVVRD